MKLKQKLRGGVVIEIRDDDLADLGPEAFARTLTEHGVEPHMLGARRLSKTAPRVWTIEVDETRPVPAPKPAPRVSERDTRYLAKGP